MSEKSSPSSMQHISPTTLCSLPHRLNYTLSFLNLDPSIDGQAITRSAALLGPLLPTILDAVYTKLLSYDITAKAFLSPLPSPSLSPPNHATTPPPPQNPQQLHLTHAHILRQKTFLKAYLLRIATNEDWSPNSKLWQYMDGIAVAHTGVHRGGKKMKADLRVEYMHLGLLLGYVEDILITAVMDAKEEEGWDGAVKRDVLRAWNMVLWVQNDLFARRFVVDRDTGEGVREDDGARKGGWGVGVLGLVVGMVMIGVLTMLMGRI
ncbi:hypothetical protein MMC14_004261 [Varicellaria rhodocarpa]|nr:hypothetical protein [Varicellaria rhodocarpa]